MGDEVRGGSRESRKGTRVDEHWSSLAGSVPLVRSLLAGEVINAVSGEMAEWYMAVIEALEHDVATNRSTMAWLGSGGHEDFLNSIATRLYIAQRKGLNISDV